MAKTSEVYNLTYQEAMFRSARISNVHYKLNLHLLKGERYSGVCEVTLTTSEATSELWIDLRCLTVSELLINGSSAQIRYENCHLYLPNLHSGQNTVSITFHNNYTNDGCGLHRFVDKADGEEYLYTQFEPFYAHKAFPCFDQPDIKATFQLTTRSPADWMVISNEVVESVSAIEESSEVVRNFKTTAKISSYLYAICAGPYEEFREDDNELDIPLGLYCRKSLASYLIPERYFHWTIQGFKFYNDFFGIKYPFGKYDQVFVPEFNFGAMENVGCVTYRDQYVFKDAPSEVQLSRVCDTFLHEMAHMWFGDLVTMKWWDDLWLNESFATFMSHLSTITNLGKEYPWVWRNFLSRKGWGYSTDQLSTTHPIHTHVEHTGQTETNFDGISYSKGSAVLKQLYFLVGPDVFRTALQNYMHEFQYRNAEFEDLINKLAAEVERQGLGIDLHAWAESWVKTTGLNELTPELVLDSEGNISKLLVHQSPATPQHPTLRSHKIIIEVLDAECNSLAKHSVFILPQETTELHEFNGLKGSCVILNVEDWGYCKIVLDDKSLQAVKSNFSNIKDLLTRQLIWRALFDMVRDIKLSGVEFCEVVISFLPQEADSILANYILEITEAVLYNYIPQGSEKESLASRIFNILLAKISSASTQEESMIYQKRVTSYMHHPADIRKCIDWVENDSTGIEGFKLGQLDRWEIIKRYSTIEPNAAAMVETELQRDKSDVGELARLYCEAAYPVAESKERCWRMYLESAHTYSRYQRDASMSGFNISHQRELLASYFDAYFSSVLEIIRTKEKEYSKDFCAYLLPRYVDEEHVISKIEELIPSLPSERFEIIRHYRERLDMLKKFKEGKELSRRYLESQAKL